MSNLCSFLGIEPELDVETEVANRIAKKEDFDSIQNTIYIPSKGRSTNCVTAKNLLENNITTFKIVVEPQDYPLYLENFDAKNLLQLPENDGGIAYARSFIKTYSRSIGETHHWQLDDDISQFRIRINNKNEKVLPQQAMGIVEEVNNLFSNIGLSGITHSAYAFAKKTHVGVNRFPYCVILVNNETPELWRKGVLDDLDYALQTLESGMVTFAFYTILFDAPSTGTVEGGNMMNLFKDNNRKKIYEKTMEQWPGRFKLMELENKKKGWTLKQIRRFYSDYQQRPK